MICKTKEVRKSQKVQENKAQRDISGAAVRVVDPPTSLYEEHNRFWHIAACVFTDVTKIISFPQRILHSFIGTVVQRVPENKRDPRGAIIRPRNALKPMRNGINEMKTWCQPQETLKRQKDTLKRYLRDT